MAAQVRLHYLPAEGLHVMEMQIAEELDKLYDLKNRRVAELERRFDMLDRQNMQLERRERLARMRRKVR